LCHIKPVAVIKMVSSVTTNGGGVAIVVAVAVGGTGVAVGGTGVAVGGTGVAVGGTGVAVGGTGVGIGVGVEVGIGASVGAFAVWVADTSAAVFVAWASRSA
jgi:hypothetical protein